METFLRPLEELALRVIPERTAHKYRELFLPKTVAVMRDVWEKLLLKQGQRLEQLTQLANAFEGDFPQALETPSPESVDSVQEVLVFLNKLDEALLRCAEEEADTPTREVLGRIMVQVKRKLRGISNYCEDLYRTLTGQ